MNEPRARASSNGGLHRLTLSEVTSVVLVTHRRTSSFTGTADELGAAYRKVLVHNLLLGWWGFPVGLVWTPLSLWRNRRAFRTRQMLVRPEGPT